MARFVWLFLFLVSVAACKCNEKKAPAVPAKPVFDLPNTPETVAQKWQDALNDDQFDLARALSTDRTKSWVTELDSLMHDPQMMDASLPKTVLEDLKCRFRSDSFAVCSFFTTDDDKTRWADSLFVLKIRGQWLVELPEDETAPDFSAPIDEDAEMPFPGEEKEQ